ncbi:MAG: hypothetical protein AAF409_00090 [Pseudomonadota bacterium]
MYDGDTFFHLSLIGRIGLVALSGAMATLVLWAAWRLGHQAHWPTRLLVALGAFVLFEWLAPQIHYLWYRQVIEGLPLQWVISWPRPVAAAEVLLLQSGTSLSAHGRAMLGWGLIAVLVIGGRFRPPPSHL